MPPPPESVGHSPDESRVVATLPGRGRGKTSTRLHRATRVSPACFRRVYLGRLDGGRRQRVSSEGTGQSKSVTPEVPADANV